MRGWVCFALLFVVVGAAQAQHGRAGSGHFPRGYAGDTWTGQLRAVNDASNTVTLVYIGSNGAQVFSGVLPRGHKVTLNDGTTADFKPSMIQIGARMRVYYTARYKTVGGRRVRTNEIFKFDFLAAAGK